MIFTAAGNSGLGAFDAVEQYGKNEKGEANKFVIGVDSNQNVVKPGFVLTSMVKRVDNAVYDAVKEVLERQIQRRLSRLRPRQGRRRLRDGRASTSRLIPEEVSPAVEEAKAKIVIGRDKGDGRDGELEHARTEKHYEKHSAIRRQRRRFADGSQGHDPRDSRRERRGKSTAMKIVVRILQSRPGRDIFDGKPVTIRNPHDAIALGIGMVHQHFMLVDKMTVAENIILGAETGTAANLDLEKANGISRRFPMSCGSISTRER